MPARNGADQFGLMRSRRLHSALGPRRQRNANSVVAAVAGAHPAMGVTFHECFTQKRENRVMWSEILERYGVLSKASRATN